MLPCVACIAWVNNAISIASIGFFSSIARMRSAIAARGPPLAPLRKGRPRGSSGRVAERPPRPDRPALIRTARSRAKAASELEPAPPAGGWLRRGDLVRPFGEFGFRLIFSTLTDYHQRARTAVNCAIVRPPGHDNSGEGESNDDFESKSQLERDTE
jgi:hypothetical protein